MLVVAVITGVIAFTCLIFACLAAASDADDALEEHAAARKLYNVEEDDLTFDDKMALRRRTRREL